jgi:hypothetical protein
LTRRFNHVEAQITIIEEGTVKRIIVLSVLALIGCGGGGDDRTPPEKCEDLLGDLCARIVSCAGSGTRSECVQALGEVAACSSVKTVGATYDRCVDHINKDSCDTLFPVDPDTGDRESVAPADCVSVFTTRTAVGQPVSPVFAGMQLFTSAGEP